MGRAGVLMGALDYSTRVCDAVTAAYALPRRSSTLMPLSRTAQLNIAFLVYI